jgi:SIR2-like protein
MDQFYTGMGSLGTSATSGTAGVSGAYEVLKWPESELKKFPQILDRVYGKAAPPRSELAGKLKVEHNNKNLVLVLGAGVSQNHGLPGWNVLLQKLLVEILGQDPSIKQKSALFSKLFTSTTPVSPLVLARFIKTQIESTLSGGTTFEAKIRSSLYEGYREQGDTNLLEEICQLWADKKKLNSIITYNFDDLVEQKLKGKTALFRPIFEEDGVLGNGELAVYHVHGYIPMEASAGKMDLGDVVFSEDAYHKQYSDVFNWKNITQLKAFSNHTCLFIGVSFNDPNVRRLLDIAGKLRDKNRPNHVVVKKRIEKISIEKSLKYNLEMDMLLKQEKDESLITFDEAVNTLKSVSEKYEETDASSLGVETIWVDDFNEIPKVISTIRTG